MSKKNFVSLILGTVGGILFALGMCMAMLPEWGAFTQGIVVGCVGLVVLLVMLIVRRKMEGKPVIIKLSGKTVALLMVYRASWAISPMAHTHCPASSARIFIVIS